MTAGLTALEKFIAETDRQRWWTTPELAVALVSSGLWAEAGLGNPAQQQIVARNGPRFYTVEVDGEDWTAKVDTVLGAFAPDLESDKLDLKSLARVVMVSDHEAPFYIYKRFGYLRRPEMKLLSLQNKLQIDSWSVFGAQQEEELDTLLELMDSMGAETAGEVLPDTGRVQFMMELPPEEH